MHIDDTIPHIDTADDPFHSSEDLRQRWRALLGPLGFSESLLWVKPVYHDRTLGHFTLQIEQDIPPEPTLADLLMVRLSQLLHECDDVMVGFAMMVTRPGRDGVSPWDRGWARLFTTSARVAEVPIETIFRANDRDVREVPVVAGRRPAA